MKALKLEFNYQKATQAINYLARKEGGSINKMKVIKLIYLADRYHLRKYARPIVNDEYFAMDFGPVGSSVKDVAEESDFLSDIERNYAKDFIEKICRYDVRSVNNPEMSVFSKSDVEALDFVYENFGALDQYELADLSHYYPEWERFREALAAGITRELMDYLDFFKDPANYPQDCFTDNDEDLKAVREIFEEDLRIASAWV